MKNKVENRINVYVKRIDILCFKMIVFVDN